MILDLTQPDLAQAAGLTTVGASIVAVLDRLAEGDPIADALESWTVGTPPPQARFEAIAALGDDDRRALHDAVVNDFDFDRGFLDPQFEFAFPGLDVAIKEAAHFLFGWLYENRFSSRAGFTVAGTTVSRATWEESFRESNDEVKVCPACVSAPLSEPILRRSLVDADHYLPKSKHPFLAVHGLNLVPICKPCNGSLKGTTDPLGDGDPPLRLDQIWYPYRRAAVNEVELTFNPATTGVEKIGVTGDADAVERAQRYDRVFRIFERWSQKLAVAAGRLPDELIHDLRVDVAEEASIRGGVETMSRLARRAATTDDGAFVASYYYEWLLAKPAAFRALVREIRARDVSG